MNGLITLLIFGALFYLMMRFGCGAHMVHGGHGRHGHGGDGSHGHEGQGQGPTIFKDPVCGMNVAAGKGYVKLHDGQEIHFCSRTCLDSFEEKAHFEEATVHGGA